MDRKKTLLEKYGIPLNHLDFDYIAKSNDAREMEKIVQILRSGEEGYYPDLTRCAEEQLRVLKPDSKMFRLEGQLKGRESLAAEEWKPIYDWTSQIKTKDNKLACLKNKNQEVNDNSELDLPPIRKAGKINEKPKEVCDESTKPDKASSNAVKSVERIKSTDYRQWDKYDPEVELLKMDLAEERVKEEVERKNRLNLKKSLLQPKISEVKDKEEERDRNLMNKLTDVEREQYAEEFRLRGNEYFRAKEYENAIAEYSKSIQMNTSTAAPAYNNRAIANIKLKHHLEAIGDCEKCLELEPQNIKAWLRKAEATYYLGRMREAYDIYLKVLDIDQKNAIALKAIEELRAKIGDQPPPNATRLKIQENSGQANENTEVKTENPRRYNVSANTTTEKKPPKPKEYDLANLIVPNRVVKNKLATAAAALGKSFEQNKPKLAEGVKSSATASATSELRLPMSTGNQNGKILIEEI